MITIKNPMTSAYQEFQLLKKGILSSCGSGILIFLLSEPTL